MDAGMRYYLYKDIKDLQFKFESLRDDHELLKKECTKLQKQVKKLEEGK
tara:strand:- start:152 stop:298 length:147 start_codon:yes stop_codon:yes gene_type:complete